MQQLDALTQALVDAPFWLQLTFLIGIGVPVLTALAWVVMYVIDTAARVVVPPGSRMTDTMSDSTERIGFDDVQPFNTDPSYEPREGLWDPERPRTRKRALPKSRVNLTLKLMLVLIVLAAVIGLFL